MKISEMITDRYKLRIPPTVYYDLLADVQEAEEEQEPKTGHWREDIDNNRKWDRVRFYCSECGDWQTYGKTHYCPNCGVKMAESEVKDA